MAKCKDISTSASEFRFTWGAVCLTEKRVRSPLAEHTVKRLSGKTVVALLIVVDRLFSLSAGGLFLTLKTPSYILCFFSCKVHV